MVRVWCTSIQWVNENHSFYIQLLRQTVRRFYWCVDMRRKAKRNSREIYSYKTTAWNWRHWAGERRKKTVIKSNQCAFSVDTIISSSYFYSTLAVSVHAHSGMRDPDMWRQCPPHINIWEQSSRQRYIIRIRRLQLCYYRIIKHYLFMFTRSLFSFSFFIAHICIIQTN